MAITAAAVSARARGLLIDPDGTRWTDAEIMAWVSDAQRTILTAKPDVFGRVTKVALVAGTKQVLPDDAYLLLGVIRNTTSDGTPRRAVRLVSREVMDAVSPDWHTATASPTVQNYIYDSTLLTTFFVYPPNTGAGYVDANYAVQPDEVTSMSAALPIPDNYLPALADYVLFRSYSKDSDFAAGMQLAASYYTSFTQFIAAAAGAQGLFNTNRALQPGDGTGAGSQATA